ncbi:MAG TPA: hypothetical protein VFE98_03630 [Candidatus Bathyarchaeia archaeon]|nr:hypothetical protein [Candidatus Bathyarchaeia archaeon]
MTDHVASRGILKDVLFLSIPLLTTLVGAIIVLSGKTAGFTTGIVSGSTDFLTISVVCALLVTVLFYGLKRHPTQLARLAVAAVTFSGTISGLLLFKLWFQTAGLPPGLFLVTLPLGYVGLRWSLMGYSGSLSQRKTRWLMIGSASMLGSLIGASFPPLITVIFLIVLVFVDVIVVETNILRATVGLENYDEMMTLATLPLETSLVGLGDFLSYSMLVATAFQIGGFYTGGAAIVLVLTGALATLHLVKSRFKFPGLLVPVTLGLVPIIIGLTN